MGLSKASKGLLMRPWVYWGTTAGALGVWMFDTHVGRTDPAWSDPSILHFKIAILAAVFALWFAAGALGAWVKARLTKPTATRTQSGTAGVVALVASLLFVVAVLNVIGWLTS